MAFVGPRRALLKAHSSVAGRPAPYLLAVYGDSFGQRGQTVTGANAVDYLGVPQPSSVNPVSYLWPYEYTSDIGGVTWGDTAWLSQISGGKFFCPWQFNRAVGGSNSGQMAEYDSDDDRLKQMVAVLNAYKLAGIVVHGVVYLTAATNDAATSATFNCASSYANEVTICSTLVAQTNALGNNLEVFPMTPSPRGNSNNTGSRLVTVGGAPAKAATLVLSTGVWTASSHGYQNGDVVSFETNGSLPASIPAEMPVYVVNRTANTFQVSLTSGGSPIVPTLDSQSGTHYVVISAVVTIDLPTSTITQSAHGYSNGDIVIFGTQGTLPASVVAGTTYFVVNKTLTTYQVSQTVNGTPINMSADSQSGVHGTHTGITNKLAFARGARDYVLASLEGAVGSHCHVTNGWTYGVATTPSANEPGSVTPGVYSGVTCIDGDTLPGYRYDELHDGAVGAAAHAAQLLATANNVFTGTVVPSLTSGPSDAANVLGTKGCMQGTGGNIIVAGSSGQNTGFTMNGRSTGTQSQSAVPASWDIATRNGWNASDPANVKGTVTASIEAAAVGNAIKIDAALSHNGAGASTNSAFLDVTTTFADADITAAGIGVGDAFCALAKVELSGLAALESYDGFRGISLEMYLFEQTATVAISNASPAVVTEVGHGRQNGQPVCFTSTGTLPTGLGQTASYVTQNIYYVKNATTDTYEVSSTPGGSSVNTSSAGSGTFTASSLHSIRGHQVAPNGTGDLGWPTTSYTGSNALILQTGWWVRKSGTYGSNCAIVLRHSVGVAGSISFVTKISQVTIAKISLAA